MELNTKVKVEILTIDPEGVEVLELIEGNVIEIVKKDLVKVRFDVGDGRCFVSDISLKDIIKAQ